MQAGMSFQKILMLAGLGNYLISLSPAVCILTLMAK